MNKLISYCVFYIAVVSRCDVVSESAIYRSTKQGLLNQITGH